MDVLTSPRFELFESDFRRNCRYLKDIKDATDCTILLALKAFATPALFPVISEYLDGVTASSPFEADMGVIFGKAIHSYSPAYTNDSFKHMSGISSHMVFNSISQFIRFGDKVSENVKIGLRINPECSVVGTALYDPCRVGSRLGVRAEELANVDWDQAPFSRISGLHFHALCENGAGELARVLDTIHERFGDVLGRFSWINFGGGHHISKPEYDRAQLIRLIRDVQTRYNLEVILEPGEAVAIDAGHLVCQIEDILENNGRRAILDISPTCHTPDVLEMPYRPTIIGAGAPGEFEFDYELGGISCLAGDIVGMYSFPHKLQVGDELRFTDMAHYTIVKQSNFNGIATPQITVV
ncbi:MAG: carboxynorspermidine decarboxylase [bacterium]|nr:carboxynorspermidine decarboxylase [bacterium]